MKDFQQRHIPWYLQLCARTPSAQVTNALSHLKGLCQSTETAIQPMVQVRGLQPSLLFLTPRYIMWGVASSNGSTSMEELSPDDIIPAICRLVDYSNSARYGVDLVNLEQVWSMGWVPFSATAWKYSSYSSYTLLDANSR